MTKAPDKVNLAHSTLLLVDDQVGPAGTDCFHRGGRQVEASAENRIRTQASRLEEGLLREESSMHVGIRGPLYGKQDIVDDKRFGFRTVRAADFDGMGVAEVVGLARERVGDMPFYLSIDIDVLDPAFAPGTGTPEPGGLQSADLLRAVRTVAMHTTLVGIDLVEVSPAYDHAEITSLAAATLAYEIMSLLAVAESR